MWISLVVCSLELFQELQRLSLSTERIPGTDLLNKVLAAIVPIIDEESAGKLARIVRFLRFQAIHIYC